MLSQIASGPSHSTGTCREGISVREAPLIHSGVSIGTTLVVNGRPESLAASQPRSDQLE